MHMVIDCGMRNGRAVRPEPPVNDVPGRSWQLDSVVPAVRDGPPYQLIQPAIRNPQSAIDF